MKKILSLLLCFFIFSALIHPQSISVLKLQQVTDKTQGEFYFPRLSPDGSKLFFTSANCAGLWYFDFQSRKINQVSKESGAGFEFAFSNNGNAVVYRINKFNENGMRVSQSMVYKDLATLEERVLGSGTDLSSPKVLSDQNVAFTSSDKLLMSSIVSNSQISQSQAASAVSQPIAHIEHQKIALYVNGEKKILSPLGEGNYIWPSVSPDGKKLLFTLAGKGTYVTDLEGNVIASLGYANAPKWSPDSKWIVYMDDKDNGLSVTSSDLYAYSLMNMQKSQLTDSKDIHEMYPEWSFDGQRIVFNSEDGRVFLMELKAE